MFQIDVIQVKYKVSSNITTSGCHIIFYYVLYDWEFMWVLLPGFPGFLGSGVYYLGSGVYYLGSGLKLPAFVQFQCD
jgi:hypothetical protein